MKRINGTTRALLAGLAALAACASMAWSEPLTANLYVGTLKDVNGYDGRPLPDGSYIECRTMYKFVLGTRTNPVAYAPEAPSLETLNPLKATARVGNGVIASARGRGLFATCVSGLETTESYVIRLFSGPSPDESVAYCDSRPFTYTADDTRSVTNVTFGVWKAMDGSVLDATDTDGDGLSDFVERTQSATDPDAWDSDGDGFSDGFEFMHDMDPLDGRLVVDFEIVSDSEAWHEAGLEPEPLYSLTWAALSNRTYHVEYQPAMSQEDAWTFIGETNVPVTTEKLIYHLEDIEDFRMFERIKANSSGFFRVRRMEYSPDTDEDTSEDPVGE
jgi:hypothetical protein